MAKEHFITKRFKGETLDIIDDVNRIIEEYQRSGMTLSLRQLYYQFVSRDLMANKQANYNKLGNIVSDARLAGLVDWSAIEDRGRFLRGRAAYRDPEAFLLDQLPSFHIDHWKGQDTHVEVWIEKDALIGVISSVCHELDVDYFACRGYNSQTAAYEAGKRFEYKLRSKERVVVLHLGDHDPSGIDMTRDNSARLRMFAGYGNVEVHRLALNHDQVDQYAPPPNPTKLSDSRAESYIAQHGYTCWELDALDPFVISDLIREAIMGYRDEEVYIDRILEEQAMEDQLRAIVYNFDDIQSWLKERGDD